MAGRNKTKLDPRKAIFISEILTGKSGAEAARVAGYSKKDAAKRASELRKDPVIAAEIERGLVAIREGAEVTAESMIRQLDADRQFAIKTLNASAATRASELKAKLVGLLIDRKDQRLAHFVKGPDELKQQNTAQGKRDLIAMIDKVIANSKRNQLTAPEELN